jgi:pyruvate formate lyase activating enzyme
LVDRSKCLGCRDCVYACSTVSSSSGLSGALSFPGEISEPEKLFDKLHPQLDLLKNIGGLTISGGEPLLQYKAIKQLLRLCRENKINTAVETSGSVPLKNLKWISGFVDVWLIGLRPIPENIHNYRLANMTMVESNLSFLSAAKKKIIIRTPVIPGYFFHKDQIEGVISIMKKHHLNYVELLPYNEFSSHFYEALGVDFPLKDISGISSAMMQGIARLFETNNIKTKIVT